MKNFRAVVQYDGTKYDGWQKQGNTKNTIQARLEAVLSKMCGCDVDVNGSGRTDAGAHAIGQVINFKIDTDKSSSEIKDYINTYLPMDIGVLECREADMRFHSRLSAKAKTYRYRIWNSKEHNVFERNYLFFSPESIDIGAIKKASELFIGEHDFKGFCSNKRYKKSTVRTIYSIDVKKTGNEITIEFRGNGFLYNMVRIITGTLIEIGEGKRNPETIRQVFESGIREQAGFTAPAEGLVLTEVEY